LIQSFKCFDFFSGFIDASIFARLTKAFTLKMLKNGDLSICDLIELGEA